MPKHAGYDEALRLAREALSLREPQAVAAAAGVSFSGGDYVIPWLGGLVPLSRGTPDERVLWSHYLLAEGPKRPRGRLISYRQAPGAAIYYGNFVKRAINPMVQAFGADPEKFLRCGLALGGEKSVLGHASFTVRALPYMPVTYVLWQGDEELPPQGNILFDEGAGEWLCAEDLVVLASLPVYRMLRM